MSSKRPLRAILPFMVQLRATPPAKQRFFSPVSCLSTVSMCITAFSRASCSEAAMSMWRCSTGSDFLRGGPSPRTIERG